jgi:epoxyqueuosine reductase
MKLTSQMIKDYGISRGLDMLGVAPISRFAGAPDQMNPALIYPKAKSVIVTLRRIPRGTYRGIEEGTHWSNYTFYAYNRLNNLFRPKGTYETACFIEDHGFEAIPIYPGVPEAMPRMAPLRDGQPGPDIYPQIRIAGVAAGLGEIGWSKVFLTKRFGPRQRLGMIITDADLEPDPVLKPSLCNRCMACVRDCPGHCIPHVNDNQIVRIQIEDQVIEWGDVHMGKCTLTHHGLNVEASPFLAKDCPGLRLNVAKQECSEEEAYKLAYTVAGATWRKTPEFPTGRVVDYYKTMLETTGYYAVCGARGCIRACMIALEKRGIIESQFEQEFRRREPWVIPPPQG